MLQENLKLIDVVVELVDGARTCRNAKSGF